MHAFVRALLPMHRCLTGDGLRATLHEIAEHVPLAIREVPTGTRVLDWTIPEEWAVYEARLVAPDGTRVVDLHRDGPLSVVQYSRPADLRAPLRELLPNLHTAPGRPVAIPYRTAYWDDSWGLCLPHGRLVALRQQYGLDAEFEVVIESRLFDGALTYGECVLPGESTQEILFTAHACHPAQANDNCSGLAVATWLARDLMGRHRRRYTYRFLFAPATLGAIAWLAANRPDRVAAGVVLANLGDDKGLVYKRSRAGTLGEPALADRAVGAALAGRVEERPFEPTGHDERQFCSPGFDLPVGRLTRSPEGEFAQYHTADDNLDVVTPAALAGSLGALREIIDVLENDRRYRSLAPHGEPQLGRRGLLEGASDADRAAMLWVLNLADGRHSLLDTAERAGLPFRAVHNAADRLLHAGLLEPLT
jgi:aminopeptidase-like protein